MERSTLVDIVTYLLDGWVQNRFGGCGLILVSLNRERKQRGQKGSVFIILFIGTFNLIDMARSLEGLYKI